MRAAKQNLSLTAALILILAGRATESHAEACYGYGNCCGKAASSTASSWASLETLNTGLTCLHTPPGYNGV